METNTYNIRNKVKYLKEDYDLPKWTDEICQTIYDLCHVIDNVDYRLHYIERKIALITEEEI